jgi:hypothetical protein
MGPSSVGSKAPQGRHAEEGGKANAKGADVHAWNASNPSPAGKLPASGLRRKPGRTEIQCISRG